MVNPKSSLMTRLGGRQREGGAAMMFGIVVLLICTVISIIVATLSLTSIAATQSLGIYTNYNAAVQDAISNAYVAANGANGNQFLQAHSVPNRYSSASTVCATDSRVVNGLVPNTNMSIPVKWSWYADYAPRAGNQARYYIYVFAYSANGSCTDQTARKVRVEFVPLTASSGCYTVDGTSCMTTNQPATSVQTVLYNNSDQDLFSYGILGVNGITLGSSSTRYPKIYSYDGGVTTVPGPGNDIGDSTAATNLTIKPYSANINLRTFIKLRGATCAPQSGGDTNACDVLGVDARDYKANISSLDTNSYLKNCTSGSPWISSAGLPLSNYGCYSSITFDSNYTSNDVVKVYTYGAITVNPNVKVNYGASSSNIRIFSSGTGCTLNNADNGNTTSFTGLIAGTKLNCTDGTGAGYLNVYGAIAASTVSLTNPGTAFYIDDTAKAITTCNASTSCRILWNIANFVSLN